MKRVFISKNYSDRYTASSKAKYDIETILEDLSFSNIGLPQLKCSNLFIGRFWTVCSNLLAYLRMPCKQLCVLQYPVYGYSRALNRAKKQGNTVITLIHDLNAWRLQGDIQQEINNICTSDYIIVHTEKMKDFLVSICSDIAEKLIVLEIFDYLYDVDVTPLRPTDWQKPFQIAFAGNLKKSQFLSDIKEDKNIRWNLFGMGWDPSICCVSTLKYHGCFPPEELYKHLSSHFGLVWDGGCNGIENDINKNYLKYIAPHKISLYLSSGLPVIVWDKSAMADFVVQNKIGVVVASIDEIPAALSRLSDTDYQKIWANVQIIGTNLRSGYYTKKAWQEIYKK